jgi:hypothetical protein
MGLDIQALDVAHWAILGMMIAFVAIIYVLLDILFQNIRNNRRRNKE